jgi:hypothetical protein
MKRNFGYRVPARVRQRQSLDQTLAAEANKRAAEAAKIEFNTGSRGTGDAAPLPDAPAQFDPTAWRQAAPLGCDPDSWEAQRKARSIADPSSPENIAARRRARTVAARYELPPEVERVYATMLPHCDLPRQRLATVAMANRYPSERTNVMVEAVAPGQSVRDGWAYCRTDLIPPQLILGLPPSVSLTGAQYNEAAQLTQKAADRLEAIGFLEYVQRPSWILLRL